ncbi:MAG: sigma-70 family RNA polymerase sigma factor [Pirellulaceae bacterium]
MARLSDLQTEELLTRLRGGDRSAAEELFAQHRPRLRRMILARTDERLVSRVDPSDVVQDTLTTACRKLPKYLADPRIPFYLWLRQIACDRLVDVHRQHLHAQKRTICQEVSLQLSEASAMQLVQRLVSSKSSPTKHLLRGELRARVRTLVGQLPDVDREVLVLKHLEELSNAECAAVLAITVEAVKKRYLRALVRVRTLMDSDLSSQPDQR